MKHGKKIIKGFGIFWLVILTVLAAIYISFAVTTGKPAVAKAIFAQENPRPLVFAHRGGGGLFPENTLEAFKYSAEMGVDVLELDIHSTADGKLVVMHDATVDRTTDGNGRVNELTFDQLKKLDAGYKFTNDGGKTFPFRGKNITVPTLDEVFSAFPAMTFNIEPKQQRAFDHTASVQFAPRKADDRKSYYRFIPSGSSRRISRRMHRSCDIRQPVGSQSIFSNV